MQNITNYITEGKYINELGYSASKDSYIAARLLDGDCIFIPFIDTSIRGKRGDKKPNRYWCAWTWEEKDIKKLIEGDSIPNVVQPAEAEDISVEGNTVTLKGSGYQARGGWRFTKNEKQIEGYATVTFQVYYPELKPAKLEL